MRTRYLLLALLSLAVYSPALFTGFFSDDRALLDDPALTPAAATDLFRPAYWEGVPAERRGRLRPVRTLSLLADRAVYGVSPAGYHFTNLALNTAAVLAAARFGTALFASAEVGFAGAALFAVYPVHAESVSWVKNRSDLLCALFFFLCLSAALSYMRGGAAPPAAGAALACLGALLSKETAAVLPAAAALVAAMFFSGEERRRGLKLALLLAGMAAIWLLASELWWRAELAAPGPDAYSQLRAVLYTYGGYLRLLFFPFKLAAEHPFDPGGAWPAWHWLALAAFAGLAGFAAYRRDRDQVFSLAWAALLLLPVSNLVLLESRPMAEQRLYLPAAGFCWLAALALKRLPDGRYFRPAVLAAVVLLGAFSFRRAALWGDELEFWREAAAANPASYRANYNLAVEYQRRGDFRGAIAGYQAASRSADLPEIYYGLAFCCDKVGEYARSLAAYGMAERLSQRPSPDLYNNMGIVCEKAGDRRKAEEFYRRALAADPGYLPARRNLERTWKKN